MKNKIYIDIFLIKYLFAITITALIKFVMHYFRNRMNCLEDYPESSIPLDTSRLFNGSLGQKFSPDEQCKIVIGPKSQICSVIKIYLIVAMNKFKIFSYDVIGVNLRVSIPAWKQGEHEPLLRYFVQG